MIRIKITIISLFIIAMLTSTNGQTNLISDGTFTIQSSFSQSTKPWVVQTWNGGTGSKSSGGFLYTLTKAGSNFWDNNISQEDLILEQGQRYVLSFDARSIGSSRSMIVSVYDTQKPSNGYDSSGYILSTTTTSFTYAFTMMKATDYDASIAFNFGLSSIDGWIDNITLYQVTDNRIPEVIPVASPTIERRPLLAWHPALEAVTDYTIQVSTNAAFDSTGLILTQKVTDTAYTLLSDLPIGTIYWRVQGEDSYWSSNSFVIKDARIPTPVQYESPTYERKPVLQWSKPPVSVSAYTIEVSTNPLFGSGDVILINSVSDTFYTIAANLPLGEIYWRVKADDSEYSETSSFVVIDNRIPELISYESPTYNRRPTLTWHPSQGTVSTYQIQIATDEAFTSTEVLLTISDTSYTCVADLPIGMIYWRVKGDDSEYSSVESFLIKDSRIPKIIPIEPKLTENQRQPVSWNTVAGASAYTIQLSNNSTFSNLMASLTLSDTVFTPSANLTSGTIYCRVKSNLIDQWSDLEYFTVLSDTLPILFRYNGSSVASKRPEFKWKSVSGASSYKIMYADNAGFTGASIIPVADTSFTPAIDLTEGSWFWKVSSSRDLNTYSPADEVVVNLNATIPVITTNPISITKEEGATATFTIAVNGSEPLTYTWYKNGTSIANSNASSYSIVNLMHSDSGDSYYCIVANSAGADTSDAAVLHIQKATPVGAIKNDLKTVKIKIQGIGTLYSGALKDIRAFSIIDMRGRVLVNEKDIRNNMTINSNGDFSSGHYILNVITTKGIVNRKFVYTK